MSFQPRTTASASTTQHCTTNCTHEHYPQVQYGQLPPLYFIPSASKGLPRLTLLRLERAQHEMGPHKPRAWHLASAVNDLREELSKGMVKERRELLRQHVLSLRSERQRMVAELYLARYPGFMLDELGRLDYGLDDWTDPGLDVEGPLKNGWCVVM